MLSGFEIDNLLKESDAFPVLDEVNLTLKQNHGLH